MSYGKADLFNALADIHGYRRYLEICTPTTGNKYRDVDRARYPVCHRLMYRCPPEFDKDGLPIDFRSPDLDISECLRAVRASGIKYDAILVDPFHEYQPSARDIRDAFGLLAPAGTMIVHDCFPREEKIAGPDYVKGEWCGVTYKAYLDFVLARRDLIFCTVDTDYGCGVVRYDAALPLSQRLGRRIEKFFGRKPPHVAQWLAAGDSYGTAFSLLQTYAQPLLNLVTSEEFLAGERSGLPLLR